LITEHNLRSWEGLLKELSAPKDSKDLFFRGHANSAWSLTTTLERHGCDRMNVAEYYELIGRVKPQVESITGSRFDLPDYPKVLKLLESYDSFSLALSFGGFPGYSFFLHLRQCGFPSPLLDWTRSPFVAAFFAFAPDRPGIKRRSIYVWAPGRFRATGANAPELKRLGPYVPTHQRHVLQQSDYTICPMYNTEKQEWRFAPHEDAMASDVGPSPNRLWKFNIPSTERLKVLKYLDGFNLNAYSLFGSEESLMETIALRELDLRKQVSEELGTGSESSLSRNQAADTASRFR
jgi:hypothetical protein